MRGHMKWLGGVLLGVGMLAFALSPSLRAMAHDFLQGFRFRRLLVIPYNLSMSANTFESFSRALSGDIVFDIADPKMVESLSEAEALSGFRIRRPMGVGSFAWMQVVPVTSVRWTVDVGRLRTALQAASADDVMIPDSLQGTVLTVTVGPAFTAFFEVAGNTYAWMQAPLPAYTMQPEGDVRPLAEAAMRLIGMPAGQARRLAQTVNWQTTLLLPIPTTPGMNLQVETIPVAGGEGTLLTLPEAVRAATGEPVPMRFLLWHDQEFLYVIGGLGAEAARLQEWARTVR